MFRRAQILSLLLILGGLAIAVPRASAQLPERKMPRWGQVDSFVRRYFTKMPDYRQGDLISRGHVAEVLSQLKTMGWTASERTSILNSTLEDGDFLVQQLNTPVGMRFMRKVKSYPKIYARLDRVVRVPGGKNLLRDVIKLPDGHRYAATNRPRGVPGLEELLPKRRSSRATKVPDYGKSSTKIYTLDTLVKRLKKNHAEDLRWEDVPRPLATRQN